MNVSQSPELPTQPPALGGDLRSTPSVPISVYRELAQELQVAQATVEALRVQNQQLTQQNQLLCQEVQRFVAAAQQLGQLTGASAPEEVALRPPGTLPRSLDGVERGGVIPVAEGSPGRGRTAELRREGSRPALKGDRPSRLEPSKAPTPLFTEQQEPLRHPRPGQSAAPDLTNLWLGLTIVLVIVTAFGAGFLIMRPVLSR